MIKKRIKSIGTVIPLGDGATGKSLLTQHLLHETSNMAEAEENADKIKKSLNVEIEFATKSIELEDSIIDTTLQFYVFPGQRQRTSADSPTFNEITDIFKFLPALKNVTVLLLLNDTTRIESLKSLELWLNAALVRGWVHSSIKIILVSTKIDLQPANEEFMISIKEGVNNFLIQNNIVIDDCQITNRSVSALTLEGVNELREEIFEWVSYFGIQGSFADKILGL